MRRTDGDTTAVHQPRPLDQLQDRQDSFRIEVEFNLPWGKSWAQGTYCFEIAHGEDYGRQFIISNEVCALEIPSALIRFEVHNGMVHDFSRTVPFGHDSIEPDRLYLQLAGARKTYSNLSLNLQEMHFYNLVSDSLREGAPYLRGAVLGSRGEQLPSVLVAMEQKQRLNAYLQAIVPGAVSIDPSEAGPYLTISLRFTDEATGRSYLFDTRGMSDGTVRAVGVLSALLQRAVVNGQVPLIGIEKPEVALHPGAAGVLFDALTEASEWVQVVATSQSPDLLDRDDLEVDIVRAVSMEHGLTTIGEIDDASRSIVQDKLYTLGELMRGNQISPSAYANQESS